MLPEMSYDFVLTLVGCLLRCVTPRYTHKYQISSLYKNVGLCHILVQSKMQHWHRTSMQNPHHNSLWQASPLRLVRMLLSICQTPHSRGVVTTRPFGMWTMYRKHNVKLTCPDSLATKQTTTKVCHMPKVVLLHSTKT